MLRITHIDIWKFKIPMEPFVIATGTMDFAQNLFIRIHTDSGIYGVGESSAFPMIVGETQNTCFALAQELAPFWIGKDPLAITERLQELDLFIAGNATCKSAFDMALHDLSAKIAGLPLYKWLGGEKRTMESDLTMGIASPEIMGEKAAIFVAEGVTQIKVKLGKNPEEDIQRMKIIRSNAGPNTVIRVDANQGWSYEGALQALRGMADCNIQFCEQPMRTYNDHLLPQLMKESPILLMADESVYTHRDAEWLIQNKACHKLNIKMAKSGGIAEAVRIANVAAQYNMECMIGTMLESRLALSAYVHFASATPQVKYYDLDTCKLGQLVDPVLGGVQYDGMFLTPTDEPGIGADVDDAYLSTMEHARIGS